jgi:RNA polymerase sigma-70 factor (ECF subfamily)
MGEEPDHEAEREARWRSWMAAAQLGDREAYQQLLVELLPFVAQIVARRVTAAAAAQDVTQEVLLSIHTARHTYRPERDLSPWVRSIARNATIDWLRRQARSRHREVSIDDHEPAAPEPDDAAREELPPALRRALEALPAAQREAVHLLKVEGLSVVEAARRVGVSPGALKLRAHRGYLALRTLLGRERL